MAKKIQIDIEVNSQSVVQATNNVDNLNNAVQETEVTVQDFGKNIKIEYDKAGKATNVLVDKSLSLTKQQRAVKAQMEILTATGKAQSKEFTILQKKYNDIGDSLSQNKARSQELFGTLSLLPGPVGAFASSLQGGLDLLKTFSGYKLSDIKNQFVGVSDDLKEIFKSFLGINKAIGETKTPTVTQKDTGGGGTSIPGAAGNAGALQQVEDRLKAVNAAKQEYIKTNGEAAAATAVWNTELGKFVSKQESMSMSAKQGTTALQQQKLAADALTASETAAATATTLLKAALTALGIGVIIGGIVIALQGLWMMIKDLNAATVRFGFAEEDATKQVEHFNEAIKRQNELLTQSLAQVDFEAKKAELIAEIQGKSEKEIFEIQKQGLINRKNLITSSLNDALAIQKKLAGEDVSKLDNEQARRRFEELQTNADNIVKLSEQEDRAKEAIELLSYQKRLKFAQDFKAKRLKLEEDDYASRLAELEAKIQLEINKDQTGSEKLLKLLEERSQMIIKHDKLSGDKAAARRELMRQNDAKKKQDALDEDSKRVEAFMAKEEQLEIAAIDNSQTREERARLQKFNQDVLALSYDYEYKKADMETKNKIFKDMEAEYNRDIQRIKLEGILSMSQLAFDAELELNTNHFNLLRKIEEANYNLQYEAAKGNLEKQELLKKQHAKNLTQIDIDELQNRSQFLKDVADLENQNYDEADGRFMKSFKHIKDMYTRKYEDLTAAENANYEAEQLAAGDNEAKLEVARRRHNQVMLDLAVSEKEDRIQILEMMTEATSKFGQDISAIGNIIMQEKQGRDKKAFENAKKLAVAGILVEKAAAIGQIWESNAIANAKARDAFPLTFGQPWVTINTISSIVSTAATVAAAAQAVSGINGTDFQSDKSSSGGATEIGSKPNYGEGGMIEGKRHSDGGVPINAEGGEAIMTRGAVTMFRPLLSMLNQAGGGTSFSKGAVGQSNYDNPQVANSQTEQQIIKTYVVEQDLTSVQHRNARLKDLSTL